MRSGSQVDDALWWGVGLLLLGWVMRLTVRAANWVWWTPRRLERALREQGICGNPYRLLFGDLRETARMAWEAKSTPMPTFSHNFVFRAAPFEHHAMKTHGKLSLIWFGPDPRVTIMDPVMIRDILSNKFGHVGRPTSTPLERLLINGLLSYEGEKWAMHRRIINPAFHVEKLKLMLPAFSACCTDLMSRWEKLLGPERSCEIDVWPELQNFTGDVISRTAFGSSFEEGRRIFQLQEEQSKLFFESIQNTPVPGYRSF